MLFTFNSCKNCTTCTRYPAANDSQKFCRADYASEDSYTQAYHYLQSQGYRCE